MVRFGGREAIRCGIDTHNRTAHAGVSLRSGTEVGFAREECRDAPHGRREASLSVDLVILGLLADEWANPAHQQTPGKNR